MADYRDFVSFEIPQHFLDRGLDPREATLSGHDLRAVQQGLEEIARTPEGEALLRKVAALHDDGKINIMYNAGGYTHALTPNDLCLGSEDRNVKYYSPETGQFHDLSVQRVLFHELQHLAYEHTGKITLSSREEGEAIGNTNEFMKKYYGEPARDLNARKFEQTGTQIWDVNPYFKGGESSIDSHFNDKSSGDLSVPVAMQDSGIALPDDWASVQPSSTHLVYQTLF